MAEVILIIHLLCYFLILLFCLHIVPCGIVRFPIVLGSLPTALVKDWSLYVLSESSRTIIHQKQKQKIFLGESEMLRCTLDLVCST